MCLTQNGLQEWLLATANSMSLGTNDKKKGAECFFEN